MKSIKVAITFALLTAFALAVPAQARSIDFQKERQVIEAISLMYAPIANNHSDWQSAVCQRMTAGGCRYFNDHLESMLWQTGQDVALDSAALVEVVATLDDGSQVWKADVSIYKACGEVLKKCPSIQSDLYLHVVYDEAQNKWLLNRALYAPYIKEK